MVSIGKTGMNQNRDAVSLWRIYMPIDVDREEYVKMCYLTGTVTITNDNGETVHKAKIGRLALQLIKFPIDENSSGSEVICLSAPYSGSLYVVDVFTSSSEYYDQEENQFRLLQNSSKGSAEVRIDGQGKILLTVDGEEDAEVTVSVSNKNRTAKLTTIVNGDILVQNDGTTTLKSSNQVLIDSPKILLNESDEPILLGSKTVSLLDEILTALGSESAGPYPLRGASTYTQLKENLEALKSTISFVK